jgi:hypothetical protein
MGISYIYVSFHLRKESVLKMVSKHMFYCQFIFTSYFLKNINKKNNLKSKKKQLIKQLQTPLPQLSTRWRHCADPVYFDSQLNRPPCVSFDRAPVYTISSETIRSSACGLTRVPALLAFYSSFPSQNTVLCKSQCKKMPPIVMKLKREKCFQLHCTCSDRLFAI